MPAEEVLVLPSSSNVVMAAERACELSEKPARVVAATSQQASLLALVELDPAASARGERANGWRRPWRRWRPAASPPPPATTPKGASSKATRSASSRARSSPGAAPARPSRQTIQRLAEGAEIVTVIAGEDAPIPLAEIDTHVPDGVEVETHEGGQPNWWWLLAAQ